jgi:hypothetical protein
MKIEGTENFPNKWETVIPDRPCPDPGCTKKHGGHITVGSDPGQFYIGLVSDLGSGALRLTPEEAFAFADDMSTALGVMLGMDISDVLDVMANIEEQTRRAFDRVEEEVRNG